jgi:DNA polymerase-1
MAAKKTTDTKPAGLKKGDHLYLIDGSGYLFRAYYQAANQAKKYLFRSDGTPTGGVRMFSDMLWKLLEDTKAGDKPTHLAVIFDAGRKTFRNEIYADYKANRPEPPEDLIPQFPLVKEATRAFGVPAVEMAGFEADDLIATYARLAREKGVKVTIVSSDKDLMQLVVDGQVEMLDTMKNRRIATAEVIEKFGVPPAKVIAVQALAGDSSDNIPGAPGIGVKTAAELIGQYGDIATLLKRASEIKQPKRREALMNNAEQIRLSERLVTLDNKVPIKEAIDGFAVRESDAEELLPFLKKMEFAQLTRRAAAALGVENPDAIAPAPETTLAKKSAPAPSKEKDEAPPSKNTPGAVMDMGLLKKPIDYDAYETVSDMKALERWIGLIKEAGEVCVDTETTSLDAMQAGLCGISLSVAPNIACYVPVGHRAGDGLDLGNAKEIKQLSEKEVLAKLKPLLEDEAVLKIGQNIKYDYLVFLQRGIRLAPIDDTMLISFVLDTVLHGHGMDALSELHLGHKPISFSDVCGKGKDKTTFDLVALKEATRYSAEDADVTLRLYRLLKPRLVADHLITPYETLERPLIPILADMERAGITIAPAALAKLSNDFAKEMARLEVEIHKLAGGNFNLGSPKQLGEILFDRMKLAGGSRTKTGAWSTDADVLEELAAQGHELPKKILEWRQLAKLRSTYTEALPTFINPQTGRVHTSYAMAAASTGRLASTDPNLQNIPIRTEEGRRIRQAFIAAKGTKLISADYSQIELRLLAHMADIPALKKAFADGLDIHAMTASEIFGVPVKGMPADVRRRAKAINFGIIYGISAFGLANQLGIPRGEADAYIKKYFERFPGIRDYMETTKEYAREHGYVETLFGRRVHIREIKSTNQGLRGGAERAAINAPLQGTAADIIRRAMIRLPAAFAEKKLKSRMLLQVHDELVIEAPDAEVEKASAVAKSVMEKSSLPAVELSVPLTVEARAGNNWDEAH